MELKYDADMVRYKADIEKLTIQVSEQKADNEKYKVDIEQYKSDTEKLTIQVTKQKTYNEMYQADMDKLRAHIYEQNSDIKTYQTNNMKMQEKVEMLMRQVDDLIRTNYEQQQLMAEAFLSGYRNGSSSGNYVHQLYKVSKIRTNLY